MEGKYTPTALSTSNIPEDAIKEERRITHSLYAMPAPEKPVYVSS